MILINQLSGRAKALQLKGNDVLPLIFFFLYAQDSAVLDSDEAFEVNDGKSNSNDYLPMDDPGIIQSEE